jgi:hypothetical protein
MCKEWEDCLWDWVRKGLKPGENRNNMNFGDMGVPTKEQPVKTEMPADDIYTYAGRPGDEQRKAL